MSALIPVTPTLSESNAVGFAVMNLTQLMERWLEANPNQNLVIRLEMDSKTDFSSSAAAVATGAYKRKVEVKWQAGPILGSYDRRPGGTLEEALQNAVNEDELLKAERRVITLKSELRFEAGKLKRLRQTRG